MRFNTVLSCSTLTFDRDTSLLQAAFWEEKARKNAEQDAEQRGLVLRKSPAGRRCKTAHTLRGGGKSMFWCDPGGETPEDDFNKTWYNKGYEDEFFGNPPPQGPCILPYEEGRRAGRRDRDEVEDQVRNVLSQSAVNKQILLMEIQERIERFLQKEGSVLSRRLSEAMQRHGYSADDIFCAVRLMVEGGTLQVRDESVELRKTGS